MNHKSMTVQDHVAALDRYQKQLAEAKTDTMRAFLMGMIAVARDCIEREL